jgi:hypothetical protein
VSLTPHRQCIQCHLHCMHHACMTPHACCMQYHWHRMHTKKFEQLHDACGVNNTVCKIWHCMHNRWTIRTALAAFEENIYKKNKCSWIVLPHHEKKNLKGLPNKKCSFMRCHWHHIHDFCVWKLIIFWRIQSRI